METQTPAITTPVMKQILASSYMAMDFWLDKFGTPLYICYVFRKINDMMLFDFERFFDLFFQRLWPCSTVLEVAPVDDDPLILATTH